MVSKKCSVCTHPGHPEIDAMLQEPDTTLEDIVRWAQEHYPHSPKLYAQSLVRHRQSHLKVDLSTGGTGLILKADGQLLDTAGRKVEAVGIAAALRTIVTVGIKNILSDPSRVSPKDTIEALRLMRSLGGTSEELAQLMAIWASAVNKPRKSRPGVIEAHEPLVVETADPDAGAAPAADPWAFLEDETNVAPEKNAEKGDHRKLEW
jgi:hypothetical protein